MEEKEKSVREITAELNLPKFKNAARYLLDRFRHALSL
jgi:hypothetical protein